MNADGGHVGTGRLGDFRQAEVDHLHVTIVGDHHVCRFHVAMDDAFVVRAGEGLGNFGGKGKGA